jgi:hypothetical protein
MGRRGRKRMRDLGGCTVSGNPEGTGTDAGVAVGTREAATRRAGALIQSGAVAKALPLLEALCAEDPADNATHGLYAEAIHLAHGRQAHPANDGCGCGSGRAYRVCCLAGERQALRRFEDREPYYRLRSHIFRYLAGARFDRARSMAISAWFGEGGVGAEGGVPREFPLEWALCTLDLSWTDEGEGYPLATFAADPSVPTTLARRAGQWFQHGRYGLWQCPTVQADPGVWLTDHLTGFRRYVSVPPEHLKPLAPWSVLGCQLLVVDGIWRTGGVILPMGPKEGAAMDRMVREVAQAYFEEGDGAQVCGDRGKRPATAVPPDPGSRDGEWDALAAHLVGSGLPLMAATLSEANSQPVRLRNTDGEPLMLVKAHIEVDDPRELMGLLAAHPDFVEVDDDAFVWQGREMTRVQAEPLIAQARAWAAERGEELAEQVGPRRVTQAELCLERTMLVAQVNSEARLERLVATLAGLGADPRVMSTERSDPAEMVTQSATTGGSRGSGSTLGADAGPKAAGGRLGLAPEAVRAWEQAWVDQPVPRLGGLTPRVAARRPDVRQDLEVLLREMEHGAARRSRLGVAGIDLAALRQELDMPAMSA